MKTLDAETLPTGSSNHINKLLKFHLPRPPHFGLRTFLIFRGPCFWFVHPLGVTLLLSIKQNKNYDQALYVGVSGGWMDLRVGVSR